MGIVVLCMILEMKRYVAHPEVLGNGTSQLHGPSFRSWVQDLMGRWSLHRAVMARLAGSLMVLLYLLCRWCLWESTLYRYL